jgi:hypothetical protein
MEIYVAHSRDFDFRKELYLPIRRSDLNESHTFTLPHERHNRPFYTREYMKNKCDLVIAEVSYPSTGMGIELGWASTYLIPIVCIYRKGSEISGSLRQVSTKFLKYGNNKELISAIKKALRTEYSMSAHK